MLRKLFPVMVALVPTLGAAEVVELTCDHEVSYAWRHLSLNFEDNVAHFYSDSPIPIVAANELWVIAQAAEFWDKEKVKPYSETLIIRRDTGEFWYNTFMERVNVCSDQPCDEPKEEWSYLHGICSRGF